MTLNKSASVTRLTLSPSDFTGRIFKTRGEALAALGEHPVIPSMEVVNGALKPFNDGLMAAVELESEGLKPGGSVDKRATFAAVLEAMLKASARGEPGAELAAVHFAGAARLSGQETALSNELEERVSEALAEFENQGRLSAPIGFYTWSPALERIFRRDRWLQNALSLPGSGEPALAVDAVARALRAAPALFGGYERVLELQRRLTNPSRDFAPPTLIDVVARESDPFRAQREFGSEHPELTEGPPCGSRYSWLPASDSPEMSLLLSHICSGKGVPANLLDAVVEAIQSGEVDLTPRADSGWYAWQLRALETLLLPERAPENDYLLLTQEYREKLVETFKSILIQTRETHVKALGTIVVPLSQEAPKIDLYPLLLVEPFPTFYLRTARAYGFVRNVLAASLGTDWLERTPRVLANAESAQISLDRELRDKIQLLYGLHLVAAASIGMTDTLTSDERAEYDPAAAEQAARAWLSNWREDRDVLADPRVAVPMVEEEGIETRNLAVVGVKVLRMHASYPEGREPEVVSTMFCSVRRFVPFEPYLLVEQSLEFTTPPGRRPLTRDELRAKIGEASSLDEIRAALERP